MSDADTFPDPDQLLRDPLLRDAPEVEGFKVLDPAILFARLGRGGMGAVYRGLHCKLNIDVAVKCLMPSLAAEDPSYIARFEREASLAARLTHQNIVRVMEVQRHGDLHYLVMEFVRGETVRERVVRKGPLAEREALTILRGACAGLAEAHAQPERIVHRDIKPDNVLISVDGKVKVADLGLARSESPIDSLSLSGSSAGSMGTPQYMPPEQWKTPKVGPTADVWALGATLYFLLTGVDAFKAGSLFELGKAICDGEFPDVRALRPDVADGVVALLQKAVRKEPGERFADAGAMLAALQPLLGGEEAKIGDPEGFARKQGAATVTPPPRETILRIRAKLEESVDTIAGGPPGARTQRVHGPLGARADAATVRSVDPEAATRPQVDEPATVPSPLRTGENFGWAPPPIVPSALGRAEPAATPAPAPAAELATPPPVGAQRAAARLVGQVEPSKPAAADGARAGAEAKPASERVGANQRPAAAKTAPAVGGPAVREPEPDELLPSRWRWLVAGAVILAAAALTWWWLYDPRVHPVEGPLFRPIDEFAQPPDPTAPGKPTGQEAGGGK